jgi:hypothetical protein
MGWGVDIRLPGKFLDIDLDGVDLDERVSSYCSCPGNMYTAIMQMNEEIQLRHMPREKAIEALAILARELNKENEGIFHNQWCVDADLHWSLGKETKKSWEDFCNVMPISITSKYNYHTFTGQETRQRIREDALRFLTYYLAGCEVTFTW